MTFDFKKTYRPLYSAKQVPEIRSVPAVPYLAVRGQGDPNEPDGAYQEAVHILYTLSYTLKMSHRNGREIPGFFDYVVPPLEGFWEWDGMEAADKSTLRWTSVIRVPDFVRQEDFDWAVSETARKKKLNCAHAEWLTIREGLCVQALHVGPFDSEPETLARMSAYLIGQGCVEDVSAKRRHHEIYLSDPRRTPPEERRTILRLPIRRL